MQREFNKKLLTELFAEIDKKYGHLISFGIENHWEKFFKDFTNDGHVIVYDEIRYKVIGDKNTFILKILMKFKYNYKVLKFYSDNHWYSESITDDIYHNDT